MTHVTLRLLIHVLCNLLTSWVSHAMRTSLHGSSSFRLEDAAGDATRLKQMINILQLQLRRFWEKAVHDRNPTCIEYGKYYECSPRDMIDGGRRDLHNYKNGEPVDKTCEGLTLRPNTGRGHFGGVEPIKGQVD